jgi:acyl-CoA hydrolase
VDIANSPIRTGSLQGELMQPALDIHGSGQTCFAEMVFPDHANHYGTLFGGTALSPMDKAAFVAASHHARCAVVITTSDKIDFHSPVTAGQLAELSTHVARACRTSMTVEVHAAGLPIPIKSATLNLMKA